MNSQSHNSDYSFPAPRSTSPRVATPPLNPEETVAARMYLSSSRIANLQQFSGCKILHQEIQGDLKQVNVQGDLKMVSLHRIWTLQSLRRHRLVNKMKRT
ncbi:unnamed protein product [Arabidopsis halleri]